MSERDPPTTIRQPSEALAEAAIDGSARFVDQGFLGSGGSAVIRKVLDTRLQRHVAVKQLTADGERAHARFLTEAQITAQLEHPHIVPVHEHGVDAEGQTFMSMKLVSGNTLWERLVGLGPGRLEPDELAQLLGVLGQVCDAVAYAHSRGVIHRDLKPSNVMVGEFGQVYLMDWGIARLAPDHGDEPVRTTVTLPKGIEVSGTPAYMAPEQGWEGEPVDPRIDVYSLGGLLYAILTGSAPNGKGMVARLRDPIVPPIDVVQDGVVPPELSRIAMKALSRDAEDRHADATDFKADLLAFQNGSWQLPTRRLAAGETVVREGDPGDEAYVIVRGRCRIEREGEGVVDELGAGDVFGEMAVLTGRPRDASVIAVTDVVLQVVSRETLTEGLGLNSWAGKFVTALAQRVVSLHTRRRSD